MAQADALAAFHFDDVRALPADRTADRRRTARPIAPSTARSSNSPGIAKATRLSSAIATRRDPQLAAKFPEPAPARPATSPPAATPVPAAPAAPAKAPDQTAETLGARAKGLEYEIPAYKYEAIFKKQEELLEPAPAREGRRRSSALASSRDQDQRGAG